MKNNINTIWILNSYLRDVHDIIDGDVERHFFPSSEDFAFTVLCEQKMEV